MKRVKYVLQFLLVVVLVFSLVGCGTSNKGPENEQQQKQPEKVEKAFLNMGTGTTTGAFYPIGTGMANIINKYVDGADVSVQATGGAAENVGLVGTKKADLGLSAADLPIAAISGEEPFEDHKMDLNAICGLWIQSIQIVTLDPSIETVDDLRGKKVSVGAVGGGSEVAAKQILECHGITYDDLNVEFLSFGESATKMKDGQLDASILRTTVPAAALSDLSLTHEMYMVKMDKAAIEKLLEVEPSYTMDTIKAGIYKDVKEDMLTAGQKILFIVRPDLDEDLVYEITGALFDNVSELWSIHPSTESIDPETAWDIPIPLHPGAEKYFKDTGRM
jgi:TRAP transporter TAXI family solute receptor